MNSYGYSDHLNVDQAYSKYSKNNGKVNSASEFNENLIEKRNKNNELIKTESEKVKKAFR